MKTASISTQWACHFSRKYTDSSINQPITHSLTHSLINQSINQSVISQLIDHWRFFGDFPSWIQIFDASLINLNCLKKQENYLLNLFSHACDNRNNLPLLHEGSVPFSNPFGKQLMVLDPIRLYPSLHLITRWPSFPTRTLALATLTWEQFPKEREKRFTLRGASFYVRPCKTSMWCAGFIAKEHLVRCFGGL